MSLAMQPCCPLKNSYRILTKRGNFILKVEIWKGLNKPIKLERY